ncbi:MAG TPA: prolipoprotein diacylglyceryl transferase family protein, partial [Longimicrobiales bacterium]|nr:prolipoprotein diacylglyceryl transferase family protein [Longimicrobiales bacterium]
IPARIPDSAVLAVHPTQLYEVGLALIMFAILWKLSGKLRPGRLFAIYMVLYAVERFFIEFVRAKTDFAFLGLTTSQIASIALVVGAWVIWRRTAGPKPDGTRQEPAASGASG